MYFLDFTSSFSYHLWLHKHMLHIGKLSDVPHWFLSCPSFKWSHFLDCHCMTSGSKINSCRQCLCPETTSQPRISQHSPNAFNQCPVHPFGDTILLKSLRHSQFMMNSFLLQVSLKLCRHVFATMSVRTAFNF